MHKCSRIFLNPRSMLLQEVSFFQGWEIAHRFLIDSLVFCEQESKRAFCLWKRANRSQLFFCHEQHEQIPRGCFFVKSNRSELFKLLFKKWAKRDGSNSLLGSKRQKTDKDMQKIWIFRANHSFFASTLLKSRANQSHWFFLKAFLRKRANERIPNHGFSIQI